MEIFNIGYERRSMQAFCDALANAKVARLIDVRAVAWSQRPEFRKTALQLAVYDVGVTYFHCKAAGNPFRPRRGETPNWAECGARYAEHLARHPEVLADIWTLTSPTRAALFCYEESRHACHRSVILEAMAKENPLLRIIDL